MGRRKENVVNRLAVVVLYNKNGIIGDYFFFYLRKLKEICVDVVVIINGKCQQSYTQQIKSIGCQIIRRENYGYDSGAYKDYFSNCSWDLRPYDEIVLSNDTFYGPFFSLKELFDQFQKENCDYWGITRHPAICEEGREIPSHIQSYFMVFKKKVIRSSDFTNFWINMKYANDYREAVDNFEIALNEYLTNCGFKGSSLMDIAEENWEVKKNPYLYYSYDLIKNTKVPFLKKKALWFSAPAFEQGLNALEYLQKEALYDTRLIWQDLNSNLHVGFNEIIEFVDNHNKVFLYGAGNCGRNIARYLKYRNRTYESFVVTEGKENYSNCIDICELKLNGNDGIIVAVSEKYVEEIERILQNKGIAKQQILTGIR